MGSPNEEQSVRERFAKAMGMARQRMASGEWEPAYGQSAYGQSWRGRAGGVPARVEVVWRARMRPLSGGRAACEGACEARAMGEGGAPWARAEAPFAFEAKLARGGAHADFDPWAHFQAAFAELEERLLLCQEPDWLALRLAGDLAEATRRAPPKPKAAL